MKNSLQAKVKKWLQEQGYTLEMRVAKAFREANFEVTQSEYYKDTETDSYREIDVIATKGTLIDHRLIDFNYIVECKYTKDKPWVIFTVPSRKGFPSSLATEGRLSTDKGKIMLLEITTIDDAKNNTIFKLPERLGYGVTRALSNGKDQAFEAVTVASKAALSTIDNIDNKWNKKGITSRIAIAWPVVILAGELFEAYLTEQNEIRVKPATWGTLVQRSPRFPNEHCVIDIVPEAHLSDYLIRIDIGWSTLAPLIQSKLKSLKKILKNESKK